MTTASLPLFSPNSLEELILQVVSTLENKSRNTKKRIAKLDKIKEKDFNELNQDQKKSLGGLDVLCEMESYIASIAVELKKSESNLSKLITKQKQKDSKQKQKDEQMLISTTLSVYNFMKHILQIKNLSHNPVSVDVPVFNLPDDEDLSDSAEHGIESIHLTENDVMQFVQIKFLPDKSFRIEYIFDQIAHFTLDSQDFLDVVSKLSHLVFCDQTRSKLEIEDKCEPLHNDLVELFKLKFINENFDFDTFLSELCSWKITSISSERKSVFDLKLKEIEYRRQEALELEKQRAIEQEIKKTKEITKLVFMPKSLNAAAQNHGFDPQQDLLCANQNINSFENLMQRLSSTYCFVDTSSPIEEKKSEVALSHSSMNGNHLADSYATDQQSNKIDWANISDHNLSTDVFSQASQSAFLSNENSSVTISQNGDFAKNDKGLAKPRDNQRNNYGNNRSSRSGHAFGSTNSYGHYPRGMAYDRRTYNNYDNQNKNNNFNNHQSIGNNFIRSDRNPARDGRSMNGSSLNRNFNNSRMSTAVLK